ncbi:MAG: hypothetical protein RLZ33_1981 [Bacteroidota bacterium]|jgi:predicted short-subunit dehydrogenase-like oxidoreductase (DUF2520 family)
MKGIQTISIIGTGNVAFHLGNSFFDQGIIISSVFGRNQREAEAFANQWKSKSVDHISELEADLILVCVSDDAISSIIQQLSTSQKIAYTSGSIELSSFMNHENVGVFYPLQTFSKNKELNLNEVPFLIEGKTPELSQELFDLAWNLSSKVSFANSSDRKKYHLAAVWVNNFTNHLAFQSKAIIDKHELNWDYLLPLLKETTAKLLTLDPYDAQTGPARRNDQTVISAHADMLEGIQKELYLLLSKSINDTYNTHD